MQIRFGELHSRVPLDSVEAYIRRHSRVTPWIRDRRERINFLRINRVTLFHCVTLLQARSTLLSDTYRREPPTVQSAAIDWFRSAVLHSGHFSPPRCRCVARGRDYRVRHPCQIDFRLKIIQI